MATTKKPKHLSGLGSTLDKNLAARLRFIAESERWNTDADLVAAVGAASTAETAYRQARAALERQCAEAGLPVHRIDDDAARARVPSDALGAIHDHRLAADRLYSQRRAALAALTARVDAALNSDETAAVARDRIEQARRLTGQASAALDTASAMLEDVRRFLGLHSPGASQWSTKALNATMDGASREVYLARFADRLALDLAVDEPETDAAVKTA